MTADLFKVYLEDSKKVISSSPNFSLDSKGNIIGTKEKARPLFWTGLYDIKKNPIYEYDVVRREECLYRLDNETKKAYKIKGSEAHCDGVVKWKYGSFYVELLYSTTEYCDFEVYFDTPAFEEYNSRGLKVVGNYLLNPKWRKNQ